MVCVCGRRRAGPPSRPETGRVPRRLRGGRRGAPLVRPPEAITDIAHVCALTMGFLLVQADEAPLGDERELTTRSSRPERHERGCCDEQ